MIRNLSTLVVVPALYLLSSCSAKPAPAPKQESEVIPVTILSLDGYNETASITVSGQFTTDDETMLSFKTPGIINKIFVKEGDQVSKGQLLATLNLTEVNAGLQQASLAREKATRDYERVNNLYKDSVATLEQLENAKTALDLATQQLNAVSFNRQYAEIRSTSSGYILHKMASEGQYISAGTPVLQTNGAKAVSWKLRCGVTDKQWAAIQTGDLASINTGANSSQTVEGTVTKKTEAVDAATGLFTVDIQVNGKPTASIAAGMFGNATIHPKAVQQKQSVHSSTWAIPYDALLDGDGSTGYVFVTDDNKIARKVKVEIAGIEKERAIISKGLENIHSIIVAGSAYLTDSSRINVIR